MNIQLTDELRNALRQNPGEPLYIHDEQSQKDYVLIETASVPGVALDWIRQAIDEGVREFEAGHVSPWNPEEIMQLALQKHARRAKGA